LIDAAELVQLVTWFASRRDERLTPIRIVKFLYLADLYHARQSQGRTLTDWPWRFVHYGPFCGEALDAVKSAVERGRVTPHPYESAFDGEEHAMYSCSRPDAEPPIIMKLSVHVTGPLGAAVRRWADDTAGLLDHVYFHTEPMVSAMPGDLLDFALARESPVEKPVEMARLSTKKIARAREALRKLGNAVSSHQAPDDPALHDEVYQKGVAVLDGEGLPTGISGEAIIIFKREGQH
jgi:hypothetical protein